MSFLRQLVDEINTVRTNPKSYIDKIEKYKGYFDKKNKTILRLPNLNYGLRTQEGADACDECIKFLRTANKVPPQIPSKGLTAIADELLKVVLKDASNFDSVDMDSMINKYGTFTGWFNRLCEFGGSTPELVVIGLLVCDGDKNRSQRDVILNETALKIGVASADHDQY